MEPIQLHVRTRQLHALLLEPETPHQAFLGTSSMLSMASGGQCPHPQARREGPARRPDAPQKLPGAVEGGWG